jgi:hypothetical protein
MPLRSLQMTWLKRHTGTLCQDFERNVEKDSDRINKILFQVNE